MEKGDVLQMIKSYEKSLISLQEKARWVRRTTLQMIAEAGSGHPGGSLSEIEILVSLYYKILRLDPKNRQF